MLGASSNNYVGALKSTSCMPKLKTWKTKVAGTFCSHIGTVFQVGAASYFACRSAAYENQGLWISLKTYSGDDDAGVPRN